MSPPVWLITGASNGFGLVMCLHVLHMGHQVIGSVRNKTKAATAVERIEQAGGSVIELNMTESQASIASKIHDLGRIDYLINVAGYSILAACEDITYVHMYMYMYNDQKIRTIGLSFPSDFFFLSFFVIVRKMQFSK